MALYTPESIEKVKDAVDMVELVSPRTELRRVGTRYQGRCPFHDDRTPSFSVNAEHGLYYCFGCNASGDAIRFVQETEALDFKAAVELLAERYGVELEREQEDPREEERRRRRERLLALVDRATDYYARYLWESAEAAQAREYLAARGLSEEVLRDFRIGYAPRGWDRLVTAAQRDGYSAAEIEAAGLGQRGRQGGFGDRFHGRVMFPLADRRGRVRGFGARALQEDQKPKYLNTGEIPGLFEKGRQLFGLDRARAAATQAGRVILVEGYTDVLTLHQAGIKETVAIMGTALTQQQLAELPFLAKTVYLALDADRAGQEAMLRAARGAGDRDLELLVVGMPEGTDPADLVTEKGVQAFTELVDKAMTVPEFEAKRVLAESDLGTPRGRDRALERIRPLVDATAPNSATRQELVRFVADRLDVPTHYVMTPSAPAATPVSGAPRPARGVDALHRRERAFLSMCLEDPEHGPDYLARLTPEHFASEPLRKVREWLLDHFHAPLDDLPADDPELAAAVTEVVLAGEHSGEALLRSTFLHLEVQRLERASRQANQAGDHARQREFSSKLQSVKAELQEVLGAVE